jgi:hypothetical protein
MGGERAIALGKVMNAAPVNFFRFPKCKVLPKIYQIDGGEDEARCTETERSCPFSTGGEHHFASASLYMHDFG